MGTYNRADASLLNDAALHKAEFLDSVFGVNTQATTGIATSPLLVIPEGNNIVGVGYGVKVTEGATVEGELAVRVYVRSKLSLSEVPPGECVPADVNGTPTDVIPVGDIIAQARSTECGVSIGHFNITAGTLGCLVRSNDPNDQNDYILSNCHVLADITPPTISAIGDDILEPGPIDGGVSPPIANLIDFHPIQFLTPGKTFPPNQIDAAIAQVINPGDVLPAILKIGRVVNPPVAAALYQSVRKHGRTTRHTVGVITDISASIRVRYGKRVAEFDDQIAII